MARVVCALMSCSSPRVPDVPFACASSFDCADPLVCASDGQCRPRGEAPVPVAGTATFSPADGVVGSIVRVASPRAGDAIAVRIGETATVILRRAPGSADVLVMPATRTGLLTVEGDGWSDVSVEPFTISLPAVPRVVLPAARVEGGGSVGQSVALDAMGLTALAGELAGDAGATAWPFTPATGTFAEGALTWQPMNGATSVALSANGTVALVGNGAANGAVGRAYVFERHDAGQWQRLDPSLVPSDPGGNSRFGTSVALSADGTVAAIGGPSDGSGRGAVWLFARTDAGWAQTG
ncbi:MAG: hypothetical protein JNG84_09985, partial [Archangium sp.]|nr:hypothetical protein [Archangium sp.]